MPDWIRVDDADYFPAAWLLSADAEAVAAADRLQDRQAFVSADELVLDRTCGAYALVFGRPLLLVIDRRTLAPGSDEWRFIGEVAAHLSACCEALSPQAAAALESLTAVVFSTSPARSYADVRPNAFVYDVDEFRRADRSLIRPAYAASNIVHDAHHIWMFDNGQPHTGPDAEVICWQLQVDNAEALRLDITETDFLRGLIANPALVAERLEQQPFERLACSQQGKCEVAQA